MMHTRPVRIIRRALLTAAALFFASPLAAQAAPAARPDSAGVRAAVLDYVEGFYDADTARLVRSVSPSVVKYGYWRARGATDYVGEPMTYAQITRKGRPLGRPGAPKAIVLLDVQDQTAAAKLTAWWGTDYLLLAREQGRWVIRAVIWQGAEGP